MNFFLKIYGRLPIIGYIAFTVLSSSVEGIIAHFYENALLVITSEPIALKTKYILLVVYIAISMFTVVPNSIFMQIATKNEKHYIA